MEFTELPTTQSNSAIVVNEYVFHRSKTNKNGSILWRCQQYFPKIGEEKCAVSCTTLDGEFLRYPQMVHLHDPPTKGKKLSMQFVDRVATEVPKSNQPLQRIWEKTLRENQNFSGILTFSRKISNRMIFSREKLTCKKILFLQTRIHYSGIK